MRIAVVGCGMSGSLLSYLLPRSGHSVDVFEINKAPTIVCACGVSTDLFGRTALACDMEPDQYILWRGRKLTVKFHSREFNLRTKNLCTFDKLRFESDLVHNSKASFHFGEVLPPTKYAQYDLVIDATGIRACLGMLPSDCFYVCYQVKAFFERGLPYPDYFMEFAYPDRRYRWMFPISQNSAYIGSGAREGGKARSEVQEFLSQYNGKIQEEKGKLLRLNPPSRSMPFHRGNVVGVGGSIGSITRLGEGIGPSIETTRLLCENLNDIDGYEEKVMKKLEWIKYDYSIFESLSKNKKIGALYNLLKCSRHYQESFSVDLRQLMGAVFTISRRIKQPQ